MWNEEVREREGESGIARDPVDSLELKQRALELPAFEARVDAQSRGYRRPEGGFKQDAGEFADRLEVIRLVGCEVAAGGLVPRTDMVVPVSEILEGRRDVRPLQAGKDRGPIVRIFALLG